MRSLARESILFFSALTAAVGCGRLGYDPQALDGFDAAVEDAARPGDSASHGELDAAFVLDATEPHVLDAAPAEDATPPIDATPSIEPDAGRDAGPRPDGGPAPPGCFAAWHLGRRYLSCEDARSRNDASMRCADLGMRLVRIDDAAEQDFVAGVRAADRVWIGATDEVREGDWTWNDGTLFFRDTTAGGQPIGDAYVRWGAAEPNGARRENCAMIVASSVWIDEDCTMAVPYVCEAL
ncbi:C-type lectin domain-containing protein [Sandaracinus amylolyticus]|uniref:C-type lectin domain-containing protein n=1 Tax=Sandaracinus amylolyticus TaxID=927083 RepID=A0A0F6SD87_9BACT|nr:C-type lectin domain-containing protein [Sandaracinus amylolyticus]AKF03014.1 hypothetical protein DB32_000162 [Sandaracinus amylolyticus]